jgi:hypothetical protein
VALRSCFVNHGLAGGVVKVVFGNFVVIEEFLGRGYVILLNGLPQGFIFSVVGVGAEFAHVFVAKVDVAVVGVGLKCGEVIGCFFVDGDCVLDYLVGFGALASCSHSVLRLFSMKILLFKHSTR